MTSLYVQSLNGVDDTNSDRYVVRSGGSGNDLRVELIGADHPGVVVLLVSDTEYLDLQCASGDCRDLGRSMSSFGNALAFPFQQGEERKSLLFGVRKEENYVDPGGQVHFELRLFDEKSIADLTSLDPYDAAEDVYARVL